MRGAAWFMLLAAGCTRANPGGGVYLDQSVKISAEGTRPRSEITLERGGSLDPAARSMEVMINDARVALHVKDGRARLDELVLTLDNILLPPSSDLPHGLALRDNTLQLDEPLVAAVEQAEPDVLVLKAHGALTVHASMVLEDGTLYPLGGTPTEPGDLSVRVTLDAGRATAIFDAAPPATCWSVGAPDHTLLEARNCAVFVESFAEVRPL